MPATESGVRLSVSEFLDQSEWWVTKSGMKRIDEMTALHRRRAALHLLRKSPWLATIDLFQQHLNDLDYEPTINEVFSRVGAPQDWIKDKPLYQKIIDAPDADPDEYYENLKV